MKALALKTLDRTLAVPTLWLGLGVVAVCAGFGLSYLRAQVEADYALALRVGPPPAVDIADADPATTGEGHLRASFHPEDAIRVAIGAPGERSDWLAVPLFAPGFAKAQADSGPRPRPGSGEAGLARAAGLAVFPMAGPGPDALLADGAEVFDGALNGPLVPLGSFALDTAAAFAEAGVALPPDFVAIRPWTEGREAALAPAPERPLARYLLWAGILSILGALALSLRPEKGDRYLEISPTEPERKTVTRSRIHADRDRFNPLIGQDDIRRGAMERLHASERAQGRTPSSFLAGTAGKVGAGWVKNRR